MKRIVLHIGFGKCASSSVQSYLSAYPILKSAEDANAAIRYFAVPQPGIVFSGRDLTNRAAGTSMKYISSFGGAIREAETGQILIDAMRTQCLAEDTAVVSCEGWGNPGMVNDALRAIVAEMPAPVDVFCLSRPPIDWLNAAFWQWGDIWRDDPEGLEGLASRPFPSARTLEIWRSVEGVRDLFVADISQDPIEALKTCLGADASSPGALPSSNAATDFDLLRHLARNHEHYGRSWTDPAIEFHLNEVIDITQRKRPLSVVPRALAKRILQENHDSFAALVAMIEACNGPMRADVKRRYLDPTAYDDQPEVDWQAMMEAEYSDAFVRELIDTILRLSRTPPAPVQGLDDARPFDAERYLELNPDVRAAGMNPYEHYMRFGLREGRRVR